MTLTKISYKSPKNDLNSGHGPNICNTKCFIRRGFPKTSLKPCIPLNVSNFEILGYTNKAIELFKFS